jgi:hypothetical protein
METLQTEYNLRLAKLAEGEKELQIARNMFTGSKWMIMVDNLGKASIAEIDMSNVIKAATERLLGDMEFSKVKQITGFKTYKSIDAMIEAHGLMGSLVLCRVNRERNGAFPAHQECKDRLIPFTEFDMFNDTNSIAWRRATNLYQWFIINKD